jgi:hypothetical protein
MYRTGSANSLRSLRPLIRLAIPNTLVSAVSVAPQAVAVFCMSASAVFSRFLSSLSHIRLSRSSGRGRGCMLGSPLFVHMGKCSQGFKISAADPQPSSSGSSFGRPSCGIWQLHIADVYGPESSRIPSAFFRSTFQDRTTFRPYSTVIMCPHRGHGLDLTLIRLPPATLVPVSHGQAFTLSAQAWLVYGSQGQGLPCSHSNSLDGSAARSRVG